MNVRAAFITGLLLTGAVLGWSGPAAAQDRVDFFTLDCDAEGSGPLNTGGFRALSPNPEQGDYVELTVNNLTINQEVALAIQFGSQGGVPIDLSVTPSGAGDFDPNNLGPGHTSGVFTSLTGEDVVIRLSRLNQNEQPVWSSWSASCGEGGGPVDDAALTVVKTAEVNEGGTRYSAVGDEVHYTVTVTNTGDDDLTSLNVTDVAFSGEGDLDLLCDDFPDPLVPGQSVECTADYTIVEQDLINGTVTNVVQATARDGEQELVTDEDEATIFLDPLPLVEREVDEATRSFLFRRMDRMLADGPDRARLLRKRDDRGFGSSPFSLSGSGGGGSGMDVAFSTSLQQVRAHDAANATRKFRTEVRTGAAYAELPGAHQPASGGGGADIPVPLEEVIAPAPVSPWDVWIEGHYTTFESDSEDGDFGIVYAGVDYLVNERLLIGLLAQFDWMSQTDESGLSDSDIDGTGWMAGPYVSAEVLRNVFLDARVAWGQSDNDATVDVLGVPYSGGFDTDRWLAEAQLSGNFTNGNWRITPEISIGYMEEKRKAFDVSDGGGATATIDETTLSLGRLTVGPEFAYRFIHGNFVFEPQLRPQLIWDFHAEGNEIGGLTIYDDDPRGAVEIALGVQADNGLSGRIGAKYDGIGADLDAFNINAWLNYRW